MVTVERSTLMTCEGGVEKGQKYWKEDKEIGKKHMHLSNISREFKNNACILY